MPGNDDDAMTFMEQQGIKHHTGAPSAAPGGSAESVAEALAYGHYTVQECDWELYNAICRGVGFPRSVAPGLLAHFAGGFSGGWEVVDLWTNRQAMEFLFAESMVDSISRALAQAPSRPDIEPELRDVGRVVIGPAAEPFHEIDWQLEETSLAERGLHPVGIVIEDTGGTAEDYFAVSEALGFLDSTPEGMIVHVGGPSNDGWRGFDVFDTRANLEAWHRHVARELERARERSDHVRVPRIRHIEMRRVFVDPRLRGNAPMAPRS